MRCYKFILQLNTSSFTGRDFNLLSLEFTSQLFLRHNRFSIDGGLSWRSYAFSTSFVLARDVVTQPGERLPVFLIYGTRNGHSSTWTVFYLNMTAVLGGHRIEGLGPFWPISLIIAPSKTFFNIQSWLMVFLWETVNIFKGFLGKRGISAFFALKPKLLQISPVFCQRLLIFQ